MGRIKRFNLKSLMQQSKAEFFFETGTWKGDGLAYAAKFPFKQLYSSEIIESVAAKARERFKNDTRIHIINDSSINALHNNLMHINGPCIFWLDAHFPGAEEGLNDYNAFEEESIKLPLQKEIEIIASRKQRFKDVILIDDLRIYEEAAFESGNLPENVIPPKLRNTNFVTELYQETHTIVRLYQDEGYLVLLPKELHKLPLFDNFISKLNNRLFKKLI
jgi:hypothetical protein